MEQARARYAQAMQAMLRRAAFACGIRRLALGAVTAIAAVSAQLIPIPAFAQAAMRTYDIPAGPLEDVLGRFGHDAGILLSFRPEITAGLHSDGLRGSYGIDGGLAALLAHTGIQVNRQANGGYLLSKPAFGMANRPLPTVTIMSTADQDATAPYAGGQIAKGGSLGILGTGNAMDVPFSTVNYTAALLENQQARTLADVVENDASVRMLTSTGGFGDTFQIRGYSLSSGDVGFNGLFGLASASHMPAAIMERVEVLKGPGTLMNGINPDGSIGGSINIVTKRAGDEPLARLTTSFQGKGQAGLQTDVSRRFGTDNAWGIRVNGVYKDGEASIKDGNQQLAVGALALDYRGRQLRWSLDTYAQHEDTDNFRPQVGFLPEVTTIPSPPPADANFYRGSQLRLEDAATVSRLEYDIDGGMTVYGAIGYRYGASRQNLTTGAVNAAGIGTLRNSYYDTYSKTMTADAGLRMRFDTAGIGHALAIGMTRLQQEAGNAYIPSSGTATYSIYTATPLPAITDARTAPKKSYDMVLTSVTLADTLSMLEGRLNIFAGARQQQVRYDSFDTVTELETSSYSASAVSPLLGVVVKPSEHLSLYANYTAGLTRGTVVPTGVLNAGQILPPYRSRQYEAGIKVDWGRMTTSAAVFQIANPSPVITMLQNPPGASLYSYDGEQRNRGLELSAYGEALSGLRLMASAAFFDAKLTHTANGVNDGKNATGVPAYTFSLAADWDTPWLAGLALNARVVHTSSVYFNAENTLSLPGWIRTDIGARYQTRLAGKPVVLRANVENLFNRNYWLLASPYATVAAPRTLLLSAQADF
ncbi:TonB-dependent siderophore receptor [Herbaspirillum chlorophenolicum]|uniref:TonB-dependent siderophore receptor n=1 Tax=Herbaspirillum chlorophenolicum TaxID=211589 RepID=A0ABW8F1Y1_9BURK